MIHAEHRLTGPNLRILQMETGAEKDDSSEPSRGVIKSTTGNETVDGRVFRVTLVSTIVASLVCTHVCPYVCVRPPNCIDSHSQGSICPPRRIWFAYSRNETIRPHHLCLTYSTVPPLEEEEQVRWVLLPLL
jgi:hypothetical protein